MYFTYFSSSPFSTAPSKAYEYQPLLPTSTNPTTTSSSKPFTSESSFGKLITTVLLQTLTYLYLRYTTSAKSVPPESLLILLSIPSIIVPLVHSPTRQNIKTLTPQSTARILPLSIFLAVSIYTTLSSIAVIPSSITLSVLSITPLFALSLSSIILRSNNSINPSLASLLIIPCIALVLTSAISIIGFSDGVSAALLSALSLSAFCLLMFDNIDTLVICTTTFASCGALALVFADGIALQRAFSLSALISAIVLVVFICAAIDMARLAPHWIAAMSGLSAPVVALLASLLFSEAPTMSAIVGLIAGAIVSFSLGTMDSVRQGFNGGANLFFSTSNKADAGLSVRI